ncbi:MAG: hypothetical protein ABDH28_00725 [Brevinematia bacterium]
MLKTRLLLLAFEKLLYSIANERGLVVEKEYRFAIHRGFGYRFDYAIPSIKVAIEIEGGVYIYGRHNNPIGYTEDVIKYNIATLEGWRVYRFTTEMLRKGMVVYPTSKKPNREYILLEDFLRECLR